MTRPGSPHAKRARQIEDDTIHAIDDKAALENSLTYEELLALRIVWGLDPPTKKRPIEWARSLASGALRQFGELNYLYRIAKKSARQGDLDWQDSVAMPYVVSKPLAKTAVEHSGMLTLAEIFAEVSGKTRGLPEPPSDVEDD